MIFKTPLILGSAALLGLTACVDPNAYPNDPNARARGGAITGAIIGGAIGATRDGDDRLAKTVAGAAVGAAVGGLIGNSLDRQAADLRAQLSPATNVVNEGDYLRVTMPQDILFATDSAALRPDLTRDLQAVASNLIKYPASTIEVVGHTDNTGSASYNQDLSQRRANSVASVLIANGVPAGRIAAYGRGLTAPIASNATPEGRAQNRRVDILIRPTRG
ncbi:OmpA family protein [Aliigemmobacter aestuarii]|uniref:OmpA family protein n=1 Tax=Aliigemmobacter aestuarii TaxID=1445661 RepID=A0A4S3MUF4_9RHOB|nr:OmpA family protein [Gemmobacter aestuarii]THD85161.1 OmpA family protein [Gemmobacter aestuarii]